MTKRLFALFMSLILVLSLLPVSVWAEGETIEQAHTEYAPLTTHDNGAHVCEHCIAAGKSVAEATVTWTAWESSKTTLPTAAGHYYLTGDMKVTKADLTADVVLCLNGKTVTANGTENNAADRFYYLKSAGSITITDCTASGAGDTYKAGIMTGGTSTAIMSDTGTTGGAITIYDGIFTGNSRSGSGGTFCVQGKTKMYMYGGQIVGNTGTSGGAIYLGSNNNTLYIENARLSGNTSTNTGGAIRGYGKAAITIKNAEIINNIGVYGCAINTEGDLILDGATITGNTSSGSNADRQDGAITAAGNVTVKGKTIITDNTIGGAQKNLFLREGKLLTVESLSADARISVAGEAGTEITDVLTNAEAVKGNFVADTQGLVVSVKDGKLVLATPYVHSHCVQGHEACTDHALEEYVEWNNSNKLPDKAGKYYLTTDVTVTDRAGLSGVSITLCLNGHTVKASESYTKSRAFYLRDTAKLTLTDCNATPGKITGFKATALMFDGSCTDAVINLYNIEISGNSNTSSGGAIIVQGKSVLNMYSSKITGNSATAAGAIYTSGTAVNLYGGEISGNTATTGHGGAIYVEGANAKLLLSGVTITENTSTTYAGGVYVASTSKSVFVGGNTNISKNTVLDKASNLYLAGTIKFTVENPGQNLNVGINTGSYFRAVTNTMDSDLSAGFYCDNKAFQVVYKENALWLEAVEGHTHCVCAAENSYCDHKAINFAPWESTTSLPQKGNYYLTGDVVVSAATAFTDDANLCLNGYTISLKEGVTNTRLLGIETTKTLSITDCQGGGKLTGGNRTYGSAISVAKSATFNLYAGTITGNVCEDTSGGMGTIYAGGAGAVVNIYGGEISGNTAYRGGGIYGVADAMVNVYGGVICNNEAYRGGAIYAKGIYLDGAIIRNNHTTSYGGGFYIDTGVATVKNSVIEGNRTDGSAGAIMASGKNTKLIIDNTVIQDNYGAGYAGGAILAQTTGTQVIITNSQFIGNTIVSLGGAIYASYDTTVNIDTTTFTGNMAEKGACIYEERAVINLSKVVMDGNIADSTKENAARRAAGVYMAAGELNMNDVEIKNSYGAKNGTKIGINGVAICTTYADKTVKDENGNDTKVREYAKVNFASGSISNNRASSGAVLIQGKAEFNMSGGEITGNSGNYAGGLYVSVDATFNMTGGKITKNTAKSAGGGIYVQEATFNLVSGTISGNTSEGHGGAIYAARGTLNLKGGSITSNVAKNSGGGIFASGATVNLSGSSITYNKADKGSGGGGICTGARSGNGITYNATVNMTGGFVGHNDAKNGGGILIQGSDKTVMNMYGGSVAYNNSRGDAGGIFISTKTTLNMSGGKIYGNTAAGRGGAVNHLRSTGVYTGGEIYDNTAGNTAGGIQAGNVNAHVTVKNMVFRNNDATKFGGTFQMYGTAYMYLENVEIYDSESGTGGAIYVSNSHTFEAKNLKIVDCTASKNGGAMHIGNDATVRIEGLTVENCKAEGETGKGGAIYLRSLNTIITDATFIGNEAVLNGGAISLWKPALQGVSGASNFKTGVVIENALFQDNRSGGAGGALLVQNGSKFVGNNMTFEGNVSALEGAAVYAEGSTTLNGLSATGNVSGNGGYAVYFTDSHYDGQSYVDGMMKLGGDLIVKDNQGGDVYMGEMTTASVIGGKVGEKTEMNITLASGVLTNKLYGEYDYEGGQLVYKVTYGSRSLTEPEKDETLLVETEEKTENAAKSDVLLYVGVGVIALAIVAAAVLLILKKKKNPTAPKADQ